MHPEILRQLAAERQRDIAADFRSHKPRRTLRSLLRRIPNPLGCLTGAGDATAEALAAYEAKAEQS